MARDLQKEGREILEINGRCASRIVNAFQLSIVLVYNRPFCGSPQAIEIIINTFQGNGGAVDGEIFQKRCRRITRQIAVAEDDGIRRRAEFIHHHILLFLADQTMAVDMFATHIITHIVIFFKCLMKILACFS